MISLVSEGDTFHSNCVCQTPSGTAWHLLFSRALLLGQCHPSVGTSVEVQKTWKKSFSKCIQLRKCRLSQFSSSSGTQFLNGELLPRLLTLIIEAFFLSIDFYHFLSCLHFRFRLFLKISSWRRILNFSSSKSFLKDKSFDTSFMGHCCLDIVQKNHHFSYLKTPGRNQNSTLDTYVRSIRSYKKFLSVLLKETWT